MNLKSTTFSALSCHAYMFNMQEGGGSLELSEISPLRDTTVVTQRVSYVLNSYFCSEAPDVDFYLFQRVILAKNLPSANAKIDNFFI